MIHVPVILGPTGAGKTAVALRIAEASGLDIISCDSRQVYRFMDIGTAKPLAQELQRARHWLVDILDPSERYSAYDFAQDAGAIIRDLADKGRGGLVCGGTGLYFDCLRNGLGPQVASDPAERDRYMERAAQEGSGPLYRELCDVDPESASRIHENDVQRIIRALLVFSVTGRPLSVLKKQTMPPDDLEFGVAVLLPDRERLYEAINSRVDDMVLRGLWDEFAALRARGYDASSPGLQGVGYQELFLAERGSCTFAGAVEKIKQNTRRYAKRQITWFRARHRRDLVKWVYDADGSWKNIMALVMKKP